MTHYERYFRDKPFPCGVCGCPVFYDSEKKQTSCGCKRVVKCEISQEDMRRHTLQGVEWRQVTG